MHTGPGASACDSPKATSPQLRALPALPCLPTETPVMALIHTSPHGCSCLWTTLMAPGGPMWRGMAWHGVPSLPENGSDIELSMESSSPCHQLVTPLPGKPQGFIILEPGFMADSWLPQSQRQRRGLNVSVPDPRRGLTYRHGLAGVAPHDCQSVPGPAHTWGTASAPGHLKSVHPNK